MDKCKRFVSFHLQIKVWDCQLPLHDITLAKIFWWQQWAEDPLFRVPANYATYKIIHKPPAIFRSVMRDSFAAATVICIVFFRVLHGLEEGFFCRMGRPVSFKMAVAWKGWMKIRTPIASVISCSWVGPSRVKLWYEIHIGLWLSVKSFCLLVYQP